MHDRSKRITSDLEPALSFSSPLQKANGVFVSSLIYAPAITITCWIYQDDESDESVWNIFGMWEAKYH